MSGSSFRAALRALAATRRPAFHMPGHGHVAPAGSPLPADVYALDQSEMAGLDYLHEPTAELAESQVRAAAVFGADRTWYLVNGATVGNLAALWSVARPGGRVLVMRRSHQSVHAAATLAGLEPVHLHPVPDARLQGLFGLDLDQVRHALDETDDVVAVHVTSPDYYGYRLPLEQLAALCHAAGVPLLVDEAHGAHLSFLPGEQGALACGADVVVQSPHKALGSLTQSALLHLRGGRVDPDRVAEGLLMLQSSSPSALLTLSLDAVVEGLETDGAARWARSGALASRAAAATGPDGLPLVSPRSPLPRGVSGTNPCKLLLDAARYGLTSAGLRDVLARHDVYPEFTDQDCVVLSITAGTTPGDVDLLLGVLGELAAAVPVAAGGADTRLALWPDRPAERALPGRTALQSPRAVVPLDEAAGAVVAAALTPYPPGVPLVLPGEVLSPALVRTVEGYLAAGVTVRGLVPLPDGGPGVRCVAEAAAQPPSVRTA
ncbi:MAG: arginine decarboxylase [Frankiales bacterium]|nr:arginine decarboxylase [Frankiales bacterium]